ncbi:hypothetical protein DPX16_8465 [Anabarilius grahami]|uniref:Uncharacterized protein n=1 Tax=Anabarilius grahami TaxID=495550 RepID=A0A3N0Z3Q1_ANAGA|nr:hypothetical protein DPX16_8465 [Anabarilius grahami]
MEKNCIRLWSTAAERHSLLPGCLGQTKLLRKSSGTSVLTREPGGGTINSLFSPLLYPKLILTQQHIIAPAQNWLPPTSSIKKDLGQYVQTKPLPKPLPDSPAVPLSSSPRPSNLLDRHEQRKSTHCDPRPSLSSFSSLYGHFPPARYRISAGCWTPSATNAVTGKSHSLHFLLNLCYAVKPGRACESSVVGQLVHVRIMNSFQKQNPHSWAPALSLSLMPALVNNDKGASIAAAPSCRMSYYLDPVSSCQALQPPDCLGVMRANGGMAVTMVTHMLPPAVCHPQNPAPPRPLYAHHITLQEVPNGPEYSPNGGIYCMIIGTAGRPLVSRCAVKRAARHTITLIDTRRRPHVFRQLQRSCTCPASVGCRRRCWQLNQRQAVNGFCVLHIWDLYVE